MRDELIAALAGRAERALELQTGLTAIPALSPENGGEGEERKALWLEEKLRSFGLTNIEHVDAPDPICVNTLQVYCAIRVISGVAKLKVVTQKCVVQNRGYFMSELYGLGDMSKEEGEGRECVICMTNDRDTCVMPCRHVCCCAECANTLRLQSDRCPVCREAITELVYLTVNPDYLNAQRDQSGTLNVEMNSLGS